MKYVSVSQMIAIEKEADASGNTYAQMMEYAGRGLAEVVRDAYNQAGSQSALGLVGSGNNGGDTLVAFCYLQEWGWQTTAYVVKTRPADDPLVARFLAAGGTLLELDSDPAYEKLATALENFAVLLDGVFGTGIRLPLRGSAAATLDFVRIRLAEMQSPPRVIAVDCPSGVDCDTGEAAPETIPAEITVTMAAIKQGLLKFSAFNFVGDLRMVGIGLPAGLPAYDGLLREVVEAAWVRRTLPARPLDGHKGTFGTVLVVGGSLNYSGAVLLAGEAAFRSGAGWVTLAVPAPLHAALASAFVEATWLLLPHEDGFIAAEAAEIVCANLDKPTALLLGPGFGTRETSQNFIAGLLSDGQNLPSMVVDADGLKLLAQLPFWWDQLPAPAVLTPHPGEMAILTGLTAAEIQSNRLEIAEKFARQWGHVVVLKGAFTLIAAPDGRTAVISVATPALGRAGTGDVLAGLIAGLRAQGLEAFEAAAAGAWIHAQAGLQAAAVMGSTATVLAGDVLAALVDVFANLE
ncbi:MAG TPA: bifunctional ADP-dependent NAD(P)H-hydrate dehydratase/NAD(P)H-hydrate epimerase [Chloroflexi bacterium]|nr:bifunctional ADP-dependent NAD(P)H-hydrate dehydratase/NAD(P)H-hydrate epimerase [Chloroflexota bacterium]